MLDRLHKRLIVLLVLLGASAAAAVNAPTLATDSPLRPEAILAQFEDRVLSAGNVVVQERIERYLGDGTRMQKLDTIDVVAEVVDGCEQYTDVRSGRKTYSRPDEVPGVWSFGEIATMLRATRDAIRAADLVEGTGAAHLRFHYPASSRKWFIRVGGVVWWVDFDGSVELDPQTGSLRRIQWSSSTLPAEAGIQRLEWTVEFQSWDIAGRRFELPRSALYQITRRNRPGVAEWNVTRFRNYSRYGAETRLLLE